MKKWLHKIEVIVDQLIVPSLLVLIVVIVMELGFEHFVEEHHIHPWLEFADYLVILIFVLDLVFKYLRSRTLPDFLKNSWLDIIAVFPFFLLFRLLGALAGLFSITILEGGQMAQSVLHTGIEVEKESVKLAQEVEKIGKLSRSTKFLRFIKPITRIPRLIKAAAIFYAEPHGKHWDQKHHEPEHTLKKEPHKPKTKAQKKTTKKKDKKSKKKTNSKKKISKKE